MEGAEQPLAPGSGSGQHHEDDNQARQTPSSLPEARPHLWPLEGGGEGLPVPRDSGGAVVVDSFVGAGYGGQVDELVGVYGGGEDGGYGFEGGGVMGAGGVYGGGDVLGGPGGPVDYAEGGQRALKIWNAYLHGQSVNVAKAAAWWSVFGTLVISLMDTDIAVMCVRIAFNSGLICVSQLAFAVAERCSIRTLLNLTTLGRTIVWSVLVPASWIVLNNGLGMVNLFRGIFVALMFIDGCQVAFANVVDIDCGGFEIISDQYNLPINDEIRTGYNSYQMMVLDLSFILFTPPVAFLLLEFARAIAAFGWTNKWTGLYPGVTALPLGFSMVFLILSLLSMWFYSTGLPVKLSSVTPSDAQSVGWAAEQHSASEGGQSSVWAKAGAKMRDMAGGLKAVVRERTLCCRLIFLALETALEDAMVSVVIPEVALHSAKVFAVEHHSATANLWAVCVIAVGKIGGLLSALYMTTTWNPPARHSRDSAYRALFWCVLFSAMSISLLPAGRFLNDRGIVSAPVAGSLVFLSSFLFFAFTTAPKMGFATMLQSLISSQPMAGRVFACVGTFIAIVDALIIAVINLVFVYFGRERQLEALVVVAGFYLCYGLVEAFIGPLLVLEKPATADSSARSIFVDGGYPVASGGEGVVNGEGNSGFPVGLVFEPTSGPAATAFTATTDDR